jgi:hypothetical protein
MKNFFTCFLIASAVFVLFSNNADAQAPRKVLFEEATSCNCGPCAASNPIFDGWLALNTSTAQAIKYHPNFGADPMYLANPSQNTERVNYCGINAYPTVNADGIIFDCCWPFSTSCFTSVMNTRIGVSTPMLITVTDQRIAGDSNTATIVVNLSSDLPAGNYKLRVMAIESRVHYNSPPGSNGEIDFYQVFRWAYPNTAGVSAPTTAGTYTYTYTYKILPTWVDTSIYTVAFVQNDNNKEVINSARGYYPVGVTGNNTGVPVSYALQQNYPNPFNPVTLISFNIPEAGNTTLKVYDVLGNLVYTLVNGNLNAGKYTYDFDGSDLASGVYVYKLESGSYTGSKRMVLLK